jgi:hypothetical protein
MIQVIKDFGAPYEVANRYKSHEPLISKEYTPLFYLIIKIISITLPLSLTFANMISFFNNETDITVMKILLSLAYQIPDIISSLLTASAMVFIVFVVLSRYVNPKFEFEHIKFDPKTLPKLAKSGYKVSIFEQVFTILGSVLFLYLFNLEPGLIAIYFEGVREPLLNSNFEQVLPFINISVFIGLALAIYYLYKRVKTKASVTIEFFAGIYSGIIILLLASKPIFNDMIIDGYDLNVVPNILTTVLWVLAILTIIGHIAKYIKTLLSE